MAARTAAASFCVALLLAVLPTSAAAPSSAGQLLLPSFDALGPQASDSISISLDESLLGLAARFLDSGKPEDRAVKGIVAGLEGVYVKSYKFEHSFTYPAGALEVLLRQLHAPCWQSIVSVHDSKAQSTVDIYICQVEKQARGLAIIAVEPRELTVVNIVGAIDLEKLHRLEGHFGIPRLPDGK